jgi:hypothetical protein
MLAPMKKPRIQLDPPERPSSLEEAEGVIDLYWQALQSLRGGDDPETVSATLRLALSAQKKNGKPAKKS